MFWPSLLMTGDMWAAQAVHFGAAHHVILVDPPGHGGSQKLTAPFTFTDCARVIVDILDGLGLQRTHFVGNSWGGMIGAVRTGSARTNRRRCRPRRRSSATPQAAAFRTPRSRD